MDDFFKLLFLKEIPGVGNAKINKCYIPIIKQGTTIDELKVIVESNECLDQVIIKKVYEKALMMSEQIDNFQGLKYVSVIDKNYPDSLRALGNKRPVLIYYMGDYTSLNTPNVAVVGTRSPSSWSRKVETQLVNKVIETSRRAIISGLAIGCDTIAHKTCIEAGGRTIAVLPSGLMQITPEVNKALCEEIIYTGGLIISEYPPNVIASNYSFVERDSLIAALSDATIVIECGKKSGTMHTVDAAYKMGKLIGAYYIEQGEKGNYEGNKYIIEKKNGMKISDTSSLEVFLDKVSGWGNESIGEQLSLFDL